MRELIDKHILDLIQGMYLSITDHMSVFINDAQALTAIFMLLYFSIKAFGMMVGDERLEIIPLLRPFAIGLVIIFWSEFVTVISYPTTVVTEKAKSLFNVQIDKVDQMQMARLTLIQDVSNKLIERSAEIEKIKDESDEKWYEFLAIDFSGLFDSIKGYYLLIVAKFRFMIVQIIEFIVITFFHVCSYLIFFIQVIFASILVILGPFSFAFSVLPAFRDAYIHWLARFISVSLYSAIGYIIMSLSMTIVLYGMRQEIDLLTKVMDNEAEFILYVSTNGGMDGNFLMISLLIGALTMLTIPIISTWIINTAGVGQAIAAMSVGAGAAMKGK